MVQVQEFYGANLNIGLPSFTGFIFSKLPAVVFDVGSDHNLYCAPSPPSLFSS